MPDDAGPTWRCPQCGFEPLPGDDLPGPAFYRPWHVRDSDAVKRYVESLGQEAYEWLLALYVDGELNLLAVDTIARGDTFSCPVPFSKIMIRAFQLKAKGFILVHNHPSGDARPSETDKRTFARVAILSHDMDVPMLDCLVIAGDEIMRIGHF